MTSRDFSFSPADSKSFPLLMPSPDAPNPTEYEFGQDLATSKTLAEFSLLKQNDFIDRSVFKARSSKYGSNSEVDVVVALSVSEISGATPMTIFRVCLQLQLITRPLKAAQGHTLSALVHMHSCTTPNSASIRWQLNLTNLLNSQRTNNIKSNATSSAK